MPISFNPAFGGVVDLALLQQQRIPATLLNENMAGTPGVRTFKARMTVDAEAGARRAGCSGWRSIPC